MQRIGRLQLSVELEAAGDHYVTLFDPVSFGSRAYQFEGLVKADVAASYYPLTQDALASACSEPSTTCSILATSCKGFGTPGRVGTRRIGGDVLSRKERSPNLGVAVAGARLHR